MAKSDVKVEARAIERAFVIPYENELNEGEEKDYMQTKDMLMENPFPKPKAKKKKKGKKWFTINYLLFGKEN